jgi:hypothetical protein
MLKHKFLINYTFGLSNQQVSKMKLRTGDIIYFTSSQLHDYFGKALLGEELGHLSVILIGEELASLSTCGSSPTHRYCVVERSIYPFEELLGNIWFRPNGSKMCVMQRQNDKEFTGMEAMNAFLSIVGHGPSIASFIPIIKGYAKMNGLNSDRHTQMINLCSEHMGFILRYLGLVHPNAILANLMPEDYYRGRFYQMVDYKLITVFDKQTMSWSWLFSIPFLVYQQVDRKPYQNTVVESLLGDYTWPQAEKTKRKLQSRIESKT